MLFAYKALYIMNWVYRSYYELYYRPDYVVYICGVTQTFLYAVYLYYYFRRSVTESP